MSSFPRHTPPEHVLPTDRYARTHVKDSILGSWRAVSSGDRLQNKQLQQIPPGWGQDEDLPRALMKTGRTGMKKDAGGARMKSSLSPLTCCHTHLGTLPRSSQTGLVVENPGHVTNSVFTTGPLNASLLASVLTLPNPLPTRGPHIL